MKCKICGIEYNRLGSHIKIHNLTLKQYYDLYIRKFNEGICPICGKETSFFNISKGYAKHCSLECKGKDPEVKKKVENTCLKKYGATNVYASEYGKTKIKQTFISKYGVENAQQVESIKKKTEETNLKRYGHKNFYNHEKARKTKLIKYGSENPTAFGSDSFKQSMLNYYSVDNPRKSDEINKKYRLTCIRHYGVDNPAKDKEINRKMFNTLWKNGGYHRTEKRCYDKLLEKFPDSKYQYKSDLYPYKCDFYIPSLDLYIELNAYWSHGGHYFNSKDKNDLDTVKKWKSKHNSFYDYAIKTWTISDLNKRDIAIKNNLNYLVFWSEQEFLNWIDK